MPGNEMLRQQLTGIAYTAREEKMGFFGKYFFGFGRKKSDDKQQSGDMRKATGAGPAIAAHSKDARSSAATGQNPAAAKKKSNN